jgi:hypothetical protein
MKVLGKEQEDVQACKSYDTSRTAAQATNTQVMAVPCILQDEYFVMFVSSNFLQILGPYSTLYSKRPPCVSLPESHAPSEEHGSLL